MQQLSHTIRRRPGKAAVATIAQFSHDHGQHLDRLSHATWFDILEPLAQPAQLVAPDWRLTIEECLRLPCALSEWEHNFLCDIARRQQLNERQEAVLQRIAKRVLVQPGRPSQGGGQA